MDGASPLAGSFVLKVVANTQKSTGAAKKKRKINTKTHSFSREYGAGVVISSMLFDVFLLRM
jgi:hypothetical protein